MQQLADDRTFSSCRVGHAAVHMLSDRYVAVTEAEAKLKNVFSGR